MKNIMLLLAVLLTTAVGCEQKVENQGNFAKTQEFFKEMDSSGTQANADTQAQTTQNAEESTATQAQAMNASASPNAPTDSAKIAELPSNPSINDIQQALQNDNIYLGKIDGVFGPKTKKAIMDFQAKNNLKADGKVGPKTWGQLKVFLAKSIQTSSVAATETRTASND